MSDTIMSETDELADRAAPLDSLLVDAALGPMRRLAPNFSTARFAPRLARDPVATGRRLSNASPGARSGTPSRRTRSPRRTAGSGSSSASRW
jgi:polyhydroxyalkanoate synthase